MNIDLKLKPADLKRAIDRLFARSAEKIRSIFFYGIDGKVMGEYTADGCHGDCGGPALWMDRVRESVYFAGHEVLPTGARDRLGSMRGGSSQSNKPYGENYSVGNGDGFATYYQDSSTQLNYADQRYYNATDGRFNTPDRYMALAGGTNDPSTPLSWNRYAYVAGDPANWREPTGQIMCVSLCGSDGGDGGGSGGGAGVGGGRSGPRPYQGLDPGSAPGGVAYEKMSDSLEAKELQDAFDLAEKILATTNCGSIYNSSVSGVQPDEELRELYTTNAFNSANLPGANASTALVYPSPGVVQNPSLEITLNNNLFGGWNNETPAQRAGTLLHELGHVYVLLWGSNASSIVTDAGNQSASNQNKATIAINCPGAS